MASTRRAAARRCENLEWFVDLLVGEVPAPATGPKRGTDYAQWNAAFGKHLSPSWVNPYQLSGNLSVIQLANAGRSLDRSRVRIDGNAVAWQDAHDNTWRCDFVFDSDGNIASIEASVSLADGSRVRDATSADLSAIEAMSDHARVRMHDGWCTIDRRGTTRQFIELLGDNRMQVVETETGELVAVGASATLPVRISGCTYTLFYTNHFRVHERARGSSLMAVLLATICTPQSHLMEGTLSVANEGNTRSVRGLPAIWETGALRAVLDCEAIAREPLGRPCTVHDAEDVCALINHAHERQECFVPYTPATIGDRLTRSPESYGWRSLNRTDHAVVGCWLSGESRTYEMPGQTWNERRGLVLDYGFARGGLAELEGLLRGAAYEARSKGITHLTLFTARPAPAFEVIERLAERLEPYRISCSIPEPADAAERGVYIDPILA